jgi:hypothetical protein
MIVCILQSSNKTQCLNQQPALGGVGVKSMGVVSDLVSEDR